MAQDGALAALKKDLLEYANEEAVGPLLDAHATLEQEDWVELLGWAVQQKRLPVVRALARKRIDLEAASVGNHTILQWAAECGDESLTRVLLEHGAQATNKGELGITPLIYASIKGHLEVVRLLLQSMKGQGLEEGDAYNRTALCHAAIKGHREVAALLLEHGANAHFWDGLGMTPLMHGSWRSVAIVKSLLPLLKPHELNVRGTQGATAMHYACTDNVWRKVCLDADILETLLLGGANPNVADSEGRTPRACAKAITNPELRAEFANVFEVRLMLLSDHRCGLMLRRPLVFAACAVAVVGG
jgi:ankyrin repeat-rich membrane spanning protein